VEENAGKFIRKCKNQNSKSAKIFMMKDMTLRLWVFVVMTFLHGGNELKLIKRKLQSTAQERYFTDRKKIEQRKV